MKLSGGIRSQLWFFSSLTILTFRILLMNVVNLSPDKNAIVRGDEVSTLPCARVTLWQRGGALGGSWVWL